MRVIVSTVVFALLAGWGCAHYVSPGDNPWSSLISIEQSLLATPRSDLEDVSLVALIASPSDHDGKAVRVIGFAHLQFEGNGLYLHREDFDNAIQMNSVWIDLPPEHPFTDLNGKYVIVEGVFDAGNHGHMGAYAGALTQVSRYQTWITRAAAEAWVGSQH